MKEFGFSEKPLNFALDNSCLMKKSIIPVALLLMAIIAIFSCSKKTQDDPCGSKGILWLENKMDSAISITVVQIHNTVTVEKDYTQKFSLAGNQPYQIKITGPKYYLDTTVMMLNCDNKLMVITKP